MIRRVCEVSERTVVVLNVGNIIDMSWVEKYRPQAVVRMVRPVSVWTVVRRRFLCRMELLLVVLLMWSLWVHCMR